MVSSLMGGYAIIKEEKGIEFAFVCPALRYPWIMKARFGGDRPQDRWTITRFLCLAYRSYK